jgi:hypothetical protein
MQNENSTTQNVDAETAGALMTGDPLIFMLVVADPKDFDQVEAELQAAENAVSKG